MAELNWLDYAGGIIGIAGTVIAILAHRRTGNINTQDLRLELSKHENTLRSETKNLIPLLHSAKKTYTRVAASKNLYHSGITKNWLSEFETDLCEAERLNSEISAISTDYSSLSQPMLEKRLVMAHKLQLEVSHLSEKYQKSLNLKTTTR